MKRVLMTMLAAAALTGGLAACETATPYQALNPQNAGAGGYRDTKLDNSHWRVSFEGNSLTSRETVERYLLYRAAELTASQGFDWFQEVRQNTDKQTDVFVDSFGYGWSPYWRFYGYGGWGGWGAWGGGPGYVSTYNRYEVSSVVMMGRGPKPDVGGTLDAREVLMNLGPGIVRPKA
jgi:hypothetical protein